MIGNWLAGRKIGFRLQTATAVTLAAFAVLLGSVQIIETHRLCDARVSLLQSIAQSAVGVIVANHGEEVAGRLTQQEAQARATAAIKAMRYQGGDPVFGAPSPGASLLGPLPLGPFLPGLDPGITPTEDL